MHLDGKGCSFVFYLLKKILWHLSLPKRIVALIFRGIGAPWGIYPSVHHVYVRFQCRYILNIFCVLLYFVLTYIYIFTGCSRIMPRKYKRKEGVRARVCSWTSEQLQSAFEEMDRNTMGINEISRQFGIPSRTLRRRYAAKNTTKQTLGIVLRVMLYKILHFLLLLFYLISYDNSILTMTIKRFKNLQNAFYYYDRVSRRQFLF